MVIQYNIEAESSSSKSFTFQPPEKSNLHPQKSNCATRFNRTRMF